MLKDFFIVGIGSFFGGGLRFVVSRLFSNSTITDFPWATLIVNLIGCLFLGALSAIDFGRTPLTEKLKLLFASGFCGGFTTFSTFMLESSNYIKAGNPMNSFIYMGISLILGMAMVMAGYYLTKTLTA